MPATHRFGSSDATRKTRQSTSIALYCQCHVSAVWQMGTVTLRSFQPRPGIGDAYLYIIPGHEWRYNYAKSSDRFPVENTKKTRIKSLTGLILRNKRNREERKKWKQEKKQQKSTRGGSRTRVTGVAARNATHWATEAFATCLLYRTYLSTFHSVQLYRCMPGPGYLYRLKINKQTVLMYELQIGFPGRNHRPSRGSLGRPVG